MFNWLIPGSQSTETMIKDLLKSKREYELHLLEIQSTIQLLDKKIEYLSTLDVTSQKDESVGET